MLSNIEKMQLLIDFKEKPVSVIFYKLTNGINYKKNIQMMNYYYHL